MALSTAFNNCLSLSNCVFCSIFNAFSRCNFLTLSASRFCFCIDASFKKSASYFDCATAFAFACFCFSCSSRAIFLLLSRASSCFSFLSASICLFKLISSSNDIGGSLSSSAASLLYLSFIELDEFLNDLYSCIFPSFLFWLIIALSFLSTSWSFLSKKALSVL